MSIENKPRSYKMMKDKVFMSLDKREEIIFPMDFDGKDTPNNKIWKRKSDVLECLNKFKEARIFLDDNKRIGCINCNELSGFYYSIFNEDKQVFELKCSDCWFKECFGSVEEVKK